MLDQLKIAVIGAGNVGQHLCRAFGQNRSNQIHLFCRNTSKLTIDPPQVITFQGLPKDENYHLIILAVSDSAIEDVAGTLEPNQSLVVHTSGGTSIDSLPFKSSGVFYPLQSFNKDLFLHYNDVPVLIESNNEQALNLLKDLATTFFGSAHIVGSPNRKKVHLAAVLVNNFVNHLYSQSYRYLEQEGLDFKLLLPLIRQTAERLHGEDPDEFQTGPARRGDVRVIDEHLEMLRNRPELRELYLALTKSLSGKYS